jgi:hypothetical protein
MEVADGHRGPIVRSVFQKQTEVTYGLALPETEDKRAIIKEE